MEIAEFLLARIAEDEAVARAAKPGPWHWEGDREHHGSFRLVTNEPTPELPPPGPPYDAEAWTVYQEGWARRTVADGTACDEEGAQVDIDDAEATHIARYSPARVLAECEVKRRIVDLHSGGASACGWTQDPTTTHQDEGEGLCDTMRALALPYADHDDYRDEWKP